MGTLPWVFPPIKRSGVKYLFNSIERAPARHRLRKCLSFPTHQSMGMGIQRNAFHKSIRTFQKRNSRGGRPPPVPQANEIFPGIGEIFPGTQLDTGGRSILSRSGSFGFGIIGLPLRIFHHGNQGMHPHHIPQRNHLQSFVFA